MNSLYFDGIDWLLDGLQVPSGKYRLSVVGELVCLLSGETYEPMTEYVSVTTVSKNASGDKYTDFDEFSEATKLFYANARITTGSNVLPDSRVGVEEIDKFGVNPLITDGDGQADVWEYGGSYTFDPYGTAPIVYLSSSSATDTEPMRVYGLDIDGYPVTQTVTLSGQANALLSTPLWRVSVMENDGANVLTGTVYCHTDPTPTAGVPATGSVRAIVSAENGRTLMAISTIPRGYVGFFIRGEAGVNAVGNASTLAEYAHMHLDMRNYGKTFTVRKAVDVMVAQGFYPDDRPRPMKLPALTDVKISVEHVSTDMGAWGTFYIELVHQSKFTEEYLRKINQPFI